MRYLRQNTAVSIVVGPFVDWQNGKSLLRDNADFVPADIVCELVKGIASSTLTLTKTGGANDIVLTGKGLATLELTAANVDTLGPLRLSFVDVLVNGFPSQTILSFIEDFTVLPASVYDSLIGGNKLQVDIEQVKGSDITSINDFKTDVSGLSTTAKVQEAINTIGALNNLSVSQLASALAETATTTEIQSVLNVIGALHNLSESQVSALLAGLANQTTVDFIKNVLESDAEVDTTVTPWQLVIKHKTTGAVLIRKALKDVNGANINSTTQVIGQHKEPN